MKEAGKLVLLVGSLVMAGYTLGRELAERDVATHWLTECHARWGEHDEGFCSYEFEQQLGFKNRWKELR